MSMPESTGNPSASEPPPAQEHPTARFRWTRRARRIRNEVGLHLLRGAATTMGGAVVAYGGYWIQSR
ncbi:hypothetical protein ACFWJ5_34875 [Streptomyces qaidamensis]|uniref:hypothetical protein n=1 Tax=Streptomyces qaidamensis TaxID=1783515 RepID=UPI00364609AE